MKNYTLINVSVTNRYIASSVDLASVSIAVNVYLAPLLLVYLHLSIIVHTDVHAAHALCANNHLACMPDVKRNGSVADRGDIASARAVENVRAVRYVVCRKILVDVDSVAVQNISVEMLLDELTRWIVSFQYEVEVSVHRLADCILVKFLAPSGKSTLAHTKACQRVVHSFVKLIVCFHNGRYYRERIYPLPLLLKYCVELLRAKYDSVNVIIHIIH